MQNEHFVAPPNWEWYILLYFFFAGLAGGAFVIGTMLRLWGNAADWVTSRIAFLISLPLLLICPILLTLDLGKPLDFWHMLFNAGTGAPVFKTWSPMSLGAWALLVFGFFAFVMFLVALGEGGYVRSRALSRVGRLPTNVFGLVFMVIGAILGIFIAAYTGVLLAVSNQPVWSDTWTLGGLFLASGLSGAAATIMLLSRRQREASVTEPKLMEADRYFIILELAAIAAVTSRLRLGLIRESTSPLAEEAESPSPLVGEGRGGGLDQRQISTLQQFSRNRLVESTPKSWKRVDVPGDRDTWASTLE